MYHFLQLIDDNKVMWNKRFSRPCELCRFMGLCINGWNPRIFVFEVYVYLRGSFLQLYYVYGYRAFYNILPAAFWKGHLILPHLTSPSATTLISRNANPTHRSAFKIFRKVRFRTRESASATSGTHKLCKNRQRRRAAAASNNTTDARHLRKT